METPDIQTLLVGIIILAAALYLARVLYRMFILGKPDCHCGTDDCQLEKKQDEPRIGTNQHEQNE